MSPWWERGREVTGLMPTDHDLIAIVVTIEITCYHANLAYPDT